jgi:hypothetical protein
MPTKADAMPIGADPEVQGGQMNTLETVARSAAQRAWSEHAGSMAHVPRYPALSAWMALAAALRRDGQADRLNRDGHRVFLVAYQAELDALAAGAQ